MRSIQQGRGETVRAYEERFRALHAQAGNLGHVNLYLKFWIKGLQGENGLKVACQQPADLDEAVETALVLEQAIALVSDTPIAPYPLLPASSSHQDSMENLFEQFAAFTRYSQAQKSSSVYRPPQARNATVTNYQRTYNQTHYQKSPNERYADTRERRGGTPHPATAANRVPVRSSWDAGREKGQSPLVCFHCGQEGHFAKFCPAKRPPQEHAERVVMENLSLEPIEEGPGEEVHAGPSRIAMVEEDRGAFAVIPEEKEEVTRMGTKRVKGQQGGAKRFRAQPILLPAWKHHIEENWQLPLRLLTGLTKRQVYSQILLGFREILGHTRKPAGTPQNQQEEQTKGSGQMDLDAAKRAMMGRETLTTGDLMIPAILEEKWVAERVIIDPGSTHTLMDYMFCRSRKIPLRKYTGPDIEMANGLFEKPKGLTESLQVEMAGVATRVPLRCVDANGSYDLLLGMDWLRQTATEASFSTGEYKLGGKIRVRQAGRKVAAVAGEEDSEASEDEEATKLEKELMAQLGYMDGLYSEEEEEDEEEEMGCVARMGIPQEEINIYSQLTTSTQTAIKDKVEEY